MVKLKFFCMRFYKALLRGLVPLAAFIVIMSGCSDDGFFDRDPEKGITIEEQLRSDPDYSSFVQALENTSLINYIGSSGLWTVFAPTNEALSGVNLNPDNEEDFVNLIKRLNYHIGIGLKYTSAINENTRLVTRNGKYLSLTPSPNTVDGVDFELIDPNVGANNGVLHKLDVFLTPPANAPELMQTRPTISKFSEAVESFKDVVYNPLLSIDRNFDGIIDDSVFVDTYGLAIDLGSESSRRTVFAPTDAAVNLYLVENGLNSLMDLSVDDRRIFLNKHILISYKPSSELENGEELETAGGTGKFLFDPAIVVTPDIPASNAVIHIINTVLDH